MSGCSKLQVQSRSLGRSRDGNYILFEWDEGLAIDSVMNYPALDEDGVSADPSDERDF
jgi:hypothetical protein